MCNVKNEYQCNKCKTMIDWNGAHERKGNIWSCEECGCDFCSDCFWQEAKKLPGEDCFLVVRCPDCYKRVEAMKEKIRALGEQHYVKVQGRSKVKINFEGKFGFADFYAEGFGERDDLSNIMNQIAFSTEVSRDHKHTFLNNMNLQIHQLNFDITHYVQGDFRELMYGMAELDGQPYDKDFLVEQFEKIIETFAVVIRELEIGLEEE